VYVWGRSFDKARAVAAEFKGAPFAVTAVEHREEVMPQVDIISCATLSATPLVYGSQLSVSQHIDLVGSYRKDMREADDETITRTEIFVDTYYGALNETGDIYIPLQYGIISAESIKADLFELCAGTKTGRTSEEAVTLFKSVGHALEDLVAARYYYNKFSRI
jgi:ornithine cyclodeaminase